MIRKPIAVIFIVLTMVSFSHAYPRESIVESVESDQSIPGNIRDMAVNVLKNKSGNTVVNQVAFNVFSFANNATFMIIEYADSPRLIMLIQVSYDNVEVSWSRHLYTPDKKQRV